MNTGNLLLPLVTLVWSMPLFALALTETLTRRMFFPRRLRTDFAAGFLILIVGGTLYCAVCMGPVLSLLDIQEDMFVPEYYFN